MALLQTLRCDQCGAEISADEQTSRGWHSLQIHDLTLGKQGQFDLCADCWSGARVPDLMERRALTDGHRS